VPFMRAYTELLVKTCHRRGAHAIGGMAAFIPTKDPQTNEVAIAKVREDKLRESGDGFDGTWVAHPGLVPVAREIFDAELGERPNQLERLREDVAVEAADLLDLRVPDGAVTEDGLRLNVRVAIQYLASWLRGTGAAAIENLMEDAATAEISRSQVWQWVDAGIFTPARVREVEEDELARLRESLGADYDTSRLEEARRLFEEVALGDELVEFLTLPGYERLCALHDER